jgi:tetratricopeptide (TPR) repeat protein
MLAPSAWAQETPPPECRYDAAGQINYAACLAAAPVGSPWRALALINLATQAFLAADYATAVRYYDEARPPQGQQMYSDVMFHAYRGSTYWNVGRREEAMADAVLALRMLRRDPTLRLAAEQYLPANADPEGVYVLILPILQSGDAALFEGALASYNALPARDWVSWANRAGVLEQLGDFEAALRANAEALRLQPDHPAVLNNQCYILTRASRAAEGISYCQRARAAAPDIGAVRHSVASAYAAVGRCQEAERELAEARRLDPVSLEYQRPLACTPR